MNKCKACNKEIKQKSNIQEIDQSFQDFKPGVLYKLNNYYVTKSTDTYSFTKPCVTIYDPGTDQWIIYYQDSFYTDIKFENSQYQQSYSEEGKHIKELYKQYI